MFDRSSLNSVLGIVVCIDISLLLSAALLPPHIGDILFSCILSLYAISGIIILIVGAIALLAYLADLFYSLK